MNNVRGHETDGLAPEKNSINFVDLLKNNALGLVYNSDELLMVAALLRVFGNPDDSATFKVWFSANLIGGGQVGTDKPNTDSPAAPMDADNNNTDNTTAAPAGTTKKANSSTGEGAQAVAATLVLATSAAAVLFAVKQKNG